MSDNITILTVNWYSTEDLKKMLANLFNKAKAPHRLKCIVIDNTNGADKELHTLKEIIKNIEILNLDPKENTNLNAHAMALNFGFQKINTEYTLMVDPDTYILKNNWDEFVINELKNKQSNIIGAPFPQWWLGTYHNFPSPVFSFFKTTSLKKINADWFPVKISSLIQLRNLMLRHIIRGFYLFNRRNLNRFKFMRKIANYIESIFPICSLDTGSAIALNAYKLNIKPILFTAIYPNNIDKIQNISKSETISNLAAFYELYVYNNELLLSHRYGSQNFLLKTAKGKDTTYWHSLLNKIEEEKI